MDGGTKLIIRPQKINGDKRMSKMIIKMENLQDGDIGNHILIR